LAIAGVTGKTKKQDVDLKILLKALAAQKAQGLPATVTVAEKVKSQESSLNLCYDWFKLVHEVAKDNNSVVSGSACNQSQQSFAAWFTVPAR
jgi:hypothetical protein